MVMWNTLADLFIVIASEAKQSNERIILSHDGGINGVD